VAALRRTNVDTDQIIPKQFLKRIERTGFGPFLFYDWRFDAHGHARSEFELNQPAARGATILLTGANFGCGSSREHAPWALQDYGFCVIIAPSFADIFYGNCCQNGLLPVALTETEVDELFRRSSLRPGFELTVDLEHQVVLDEAGFAAGFAIAPYRREMLMQGLDEIGRTLLEEERIVAYERGRGLRPA
jgi:3-isopropylmalate/(R)-2-methylmalate dehydratase small subunit